MNSSCYMKFASPGFTPLSAVVTTTVGEVTTLSLQRSVNVAERLFRLTGAGIFRDTALLGRPVPIAQPYISAGVVGQDSLDPAPKRSKLKSAAMALSTIASSKPGAGPAAKAASAEAEASNVAAGEIEHGVAEGSNPTKRSASGEAQQGKTSALEAQLGMPAGTLGTKRLKDTIRTIVRGQCMDELTARIVREALEDLLGLDRDRLKPQKSVLAKLLDQVLAAEAERG